MSNNNSASNTSKFWTGGFLTLGNIRDTALISLISTATWKALNSSISVNLESFSFTDLLSMLLAFFATALSAAFYFKATDSSNMFYDNTYKFTKEVSEILGRIEAGFGERLKHIDEGYSGLRERFEKMPFDLNAAKAEREKEEQHIEEQENERNKIILDLMEKARIAGEEKDKLLSKLNDYTTELENSKLELNKLQQKINKAEESSSELPGGFIKYLANRLSNITTSSHHNAPKGILIRKLDSLISENLLDNSDLKFMERHELLRDGELTDKGVSAMRQAIRNIDKR